MEREMLLKWLREEDERSLDELWRQADHVRREHVGDEVHLRGLVEISNYCVRQCHYCGLRGGNAKLPRYRMPAGEILESAHKAVALGYGTVVLQSGEDYGLETAWLVEVVRRIRRETPLAVTLSLGERPDSDLAALREAGADRYLLRFETSNRALYDCIHPSLPGRHSDRFEILGALARLGFEIGSGIMIGIPGQTYEDLANDIAKFAEIDLEMIGVGPYIAHPDTPLGKNCLTGSGVDRLAGEQVPNSELMTYKVLALTRITCPDTNIPATTALATINRARGRELGLMRGANVVMPNLTPIKYRGMYEIYPAKACINETAEECNGCIKRRIMSVGRTIGAGRGDSPKFRKRARRDGA